MSNLRDPRSIPGGPLTPIRGIPDHPTSPPAGSDVPLLRILLVDDNGATLDFLTDVFTANGCLTLPALTAEHALDLLSSQAVDLVIADIMLPRLSGLDLLRAVKGTHPHTPVVLITGLPSVNSAVFGLRYGAYDYLSKPFSVADVQQLLQRLRTDRPPGHGAAGYPAGLLDEIARRQLGMEGLFRIGALALEDVDPARLLDSLLDYVAQSLQSHAAVLVIRDQDGTLTSASHGHPTLAHHLVSACRPIADGTAGGAEVLPVQGPAAFVVALAGRVPVADQAVAVLGVARDRSGGGFLPEEQEFFRAYVQTTGLALQKLFLRDRAESEPIEVMSVFVTALDSLESKDSSLRGHSPRVSMYAGELATALGLPRAQVAVSRRAGLLHDLGKLVLPDSILLKPGPLTEEEYALVQRHSVIGARILQRLRFFGDEAEAVRHHLERYDGTGVPDRLSGEAIPLPARILAVADAFDAMMSPRPYRGALALDVALAELARGAGTQFDPTVVQAFTAIPRARLTEIGQYYGSRSRSTRGPESEEAFQDRLEISPAGRQEPNAVTPEPGDRLAESDGGTPAEMAVGLADAAGPETPSGGPGVAEEPSDQVLAPQSSNFFVVARGHRDLVEELKALLGGDLTSIRVIEDRRRDQTILPREGREGRARVDWEIDA